MRKPVKEIMECNMQSGLSIYLKNEIIQKGIRYREKNIIEVTYQYITRPVVMRIEFE